MKYEAPLPGNPNRIAIDQHVFPRSAIERFVNPQGLVQVQRLAASTSFAANPKNPIFCAQRAWDQATETWRTSPYEVAYASLADKISAGDVTTLTPELDVVVSEF